jgi:hypothetical protein
LAVRSNDRWILLGCVALAILAVAAIYFASTQPGFTEADPVCAIALPTNDRLRLVVWCLGMLHMGAHLSALATRPCPVTVVGDKDGEEL